MLRHCGKITNQHRCKETIAVVVAVLIVTTLQVSSKPITTTKLELMTATILVIRLIARVIMTLMIIITTTIPVTYSVNS